MFYNPLVPINRALKNYVCKSVLLFLLLFSAFTAHTQNPLVSAQEFNVFTEGNLSITAGDIEGAIAVGGNFVVLGNSQRTSLNTTGGVSYVTIGGVKYALIVGGGLSGVNGGNIFKVDGKSGSTDDHYIRFYSLSGSTAASNSGGIDIGNPVTTTTNRYVRVNSTTQTAASVQNTTALVNFSAAFTEFRSQSTSMAGCTGNVTPTVSGGQATLNLGANANNVWNVSGTTLNSYSQINLTGNLPSASKPLIINVNAAGTFSWNNLKFVMGSESDNSMEINRAPYIIWNFYNTTSLTIATSNLILGSVLAPNADVKINGSGNITGQFIAKSLTKPNAGEFHIAKFNANVSCATTSCSCAGNLVLNPSFENGTTGWSSSGGTLNAGSGAVACGSYSGDFQITNTSSNWVSQTIGTDLPIGTVINASVYAGTHNNSYYHEVGIYFFDANWNWIGGSTQEVNKVLSATPTGPQLYTWSGVVPPGTKYTQVGYNGNGDWIKTDSWCVTLAQSTKVALGNQVFIDVNGNGVKDGSDWGYDGITVKLYTDANEDGIPDGVALASTVTNNGGYYYFSNLPPGKYLVQVENAPSWMFLVPQNGGDPDNDIDNDNNGLTQSGTTIKGGTISLSVGGEPGGSNYNGTYDFAVFKTNGLGDFVFLDNNANGIQDAGEVGIAGVTVKLRNSTGTVLATTTTDATGYYFFYDASQYGTYNYQLEFVTPAGYAASPSNKGSDDNKDSDPVGGVIPTFTVPNGVWNYSFDAGFYKPASLGDFVWNDVNANGVQDAGEAGISGVTVTLTGTTGGGTAVNRTTTTNASGAYSFTNLAPGTYSVSFTTPSGYVASPSNQGADDTKDSDPVSGAVTGIVLTSGQTNNTIDAGFYQPAALGDFVWNDANANGIQDAGEAGISNVTVTLTGTTGNGASVNQTTTTNASGAYSFTNLAPGTYTVSFTTPSGYAVSPSNQGADDAKDSDPVSGAVTGIVLVSGQTNNTIDAGFYQPAAIGDFVWNDANANGIQDAGETGISGVTVTLTGTTGSGAAINLTTTTNASGAYSFTNLAPGTYTVTFSTPSGYVASPSNIGDDSKDSDPVSGAVTGIVVTSGQTNNTIDAGFQSNQLNLGNYVWYDKNNNGVQDAGETGISGATVKLYADATGDNIADGAALATTTTNASGIYSFTGLTPGNYIVGVVIPAGYAAGATTATTSSPNNDNNTDNNGVVVVSGELRSNYITLTTGGEPTTDGDGSNGNLTLDFGLTGTGALGDFVWNDVNGNGIQDAGEAGISGVTVTVTYPGGSTATTTTNASGAYSFTNLAPGTYSVSFATPSGYVASPSNKGADDSKDSDPVSGVVSGIVLTAGQTNNTIDAGFYQPAALGDYVWYDRNGNGIQEAGEPGISGATVTLTGTTGGGTAINQTTTTNSNGAYSFTNLAPGTYTVTFTTPSGFTPTLSNQGGDDSKDSDPVSGVVSGIVLSSGQTNNTIDAGFIGLKVMISGNLFYDANGMRDNLVNGTYMIPSGVNAVLYDPTTNTVLAVQAIPGYQQPGQGTFSFSVDPYSQYRVMLSTSNPAVGSQAPVSASLPFSFISTGEVIGTGLGNDGTVDGKSAVINVFTSNITNVNFAISRFTIVVVD